MAEIKVLELDDWNTPASRYEPKQIGDYRIGKHTYQPGIYAYHGIDGYMLFSLKKSVELTTLLQQRQGRLSWREWMADDPPDYKAMQKYADNAHGRVLTCGLGLGLLTQELCKNKNVTDITITEISPNVIELISPYLNGDKKIDIVCQDFWKFVDKDDTQWDTIIVDIWVFWGMAQQLKIYREEILPASKKLKSKYPEAYIVFHGFAGLPTEDEINRVISQGNENNALIIDPLIYGLGN